MIYQLITGTIYLIGGIIIFNNQKKYPSPQNVMNTIVKYYMGLGFVSIGLWNLFIINIDLPFVKWMNANFVYLNPVISLCVFLALLVIQHVHKKK
jgi:predicted small integral membrane protein